VASTLGYLAADCGPGTTGILEVASDPGSASIFVDGVFMANTTATLHLNPGQHSERMTLDGYKEWTQDSRVESGATGRLNAELEKLN